MRSCGNEIDLGALLDDVAYLGPDPVGEGWLQTVQDGADTLVQIDADGGGDDFQTIVTVHNVDATDFTMDNRTF